ncbi:MAG: hypothetical protein Q7J54_03700 [Candidatus Woesearchaeota archaeon]|nr:hypothetical protein [Candidatus Woesearchaeota archaeon]
MKQKYYLIVGIIALIIIAGLFLVMNQERSKPLPQAVFLPNVNFEGTVLSLSLVGGEEEGGDITRPRDTTVVRIDKINSISGDFDWVSAGIEEGKEITIQLQYSARPTKIRKVFDPEAPASSGNESAVSATLSFTKENGYFVYSTKSGTITEETEITLPGLEEGSKFKTTGWYGYSGIKVLTIGEYEII